MSGPVSCDDLADALERRIGAKVVSGDLSRPGIAQFVMRAPGNAWWNAIERGRLLEVAPGPLVWRLDMFATGDEDTFTLTVQPRLWIGAPATGPFVAHMAGRMLAAPDEGRRDG